jgi:phosphopantetheinyl transferase
MVYLLDASGTGGDAETLRDAARAFTAQATQSHASRSYCFPFALVALHGYPVGVDIERVTTWTAAQLDSVLTPSERARRPEADDLWATSLWSSKEALTKAVGIPVDYDPRHVESPLSWPDFTAGRWRASSLSVPEDHVAWVCWQPRSPAPGR